MVRKEKLSTGMLTAERKEMSKFIEKLRVYNPNTNPATIDINFDALKWVG